ncbi:hypothetical protein POVCU1_058100 [Plasmodium ovale curtisi]|uniref:Uncharacterized protein n=1 Tax=Plasmodium ovale curtisi TaxID=864141 RepID=A0A1A8X8M8_PLAOA|nr:hypothetical protein POVCU1_058100 [Plasmodium ovale curtisi]
MYARRNSQYRNEHLPTSNINIYASKCNCSLFSDCNKGSVTESLKHTIMFHLILPFKLKYERAELGQCKVFREKTYLNKGKTKNEKRNEQRGKSKEEGAKRKEQGGRCKLHGANRKMQKQISR